MAESILDGLGKGVSAGVDNNKQLHVFSVTESESNQAVESGDNYNLNTGIIALTGTSESGILYLKNAEAPVNGEGALIITTIIIGINSISATITENPIVTFIRNPTAGTVVSDATALDMVSNSNFGSSNTPASLAYKGAQGKTLTGGTDHAIVLCKEGRTTIPELHLDLPIGSALGIKIDLNTSGGANVYAAVVCHRKNGKNEI